MPATPLGNHAVDIVPLGAANAAGYRALAIAVLTEFGMQEDPLLDADLEAPLDAYEAAWVGVRDGEVVGTVGLQRQDGGDLRLKRMFVSPALRGRGLGRALLDTAVDHARRAGAHAVHLETLSIMATAQHLYERAGFERTGTRTEQGAHDSRCEVLYTLDLR
jgi:ribosomal protein S18 acetylase RimI-like enzyme